MKKEHKILTITIISIIAFVVIMGTLLAPNGHGCIQSYQYPKNGIELEKNIKLLLQNPKYTLPICFDTFFRDTSTPYFDARCSNGRNAWVYKFRIFYDYRKTPSVFGLIRVSDSCAILDTPHYVDCDYCNFKSEKKIS